MTNATSSPAIVTETREGFQFGASPCCEGASATINAEYAVGEQSHPGGWTIANNEIVRYNYIRCGKCGGEQWS